TTSSAPTCSRLQRVSAYWEFFSIITQQALRRGNFPTVADLIAAIERFIAAWNDRCRPFIWIKDPYTVIAKATNQRHRKTTKTSVAEH
ncbi:MAG TPA: hypothetical protein VM684_18320, partial [Gaiellales bacterium]|nr:hypothetical protein [Gaiellales bacterium]